MDTKTLIAEDLLKMQKQRQVIQVINSIRIVI